MVGWTDFPYNNAFFGLEFFCLTLVRNQAGLGWGRILDYGSMKLWRLCELSCWTLSFGPIFLSIATFTPLKFFPASLPLIFMVGWKLEGHVRSFAFPIGALVTLKRGELFNFRWVIVWNPRENHVLYWDPCGDDERIFADPWMVDVCLGKGILGSSTWFSVWLQLYCVHISQWLPVIRPHQDFW